MEFPGIPFEETPRSHILLSRFLCLPVIDYLCWQIPSTVSMLLSTSLPTHTLLMYIHTLTLNHSACFDCRQFLSATGRNLCECMKNHVSHIWKHIEKCFMSNNKQSCCNLSGLFMLFSFSLTLLCVFSPLWLGPLSVLYLFLLISEFLSGQPNMSEYNDLRHFSATLLGKAQQGWKNAALLYHCIQW